MVDRTCRDGGVPPGECRPPSPPTARNQSEGLRELALVPAVDGAERVGDPHPTTRVLPDGGYQQHELLMGLSRSTDRTGAERTRLTHVSRPEPHKVGRNVLGLQGLV
ncbi:hypothetical protein GCM10010271_70380 [Streptomyces kurssanovii]|nr:hypothetical protein GCM10010271_70380 [Streptomyces kurssanovii]